MDTSNVVIQVIKSSQTVTTPTPGSSANWDAHFTMAPFVAASGAGRAFVGTKRAVITTSDFQPTSTISNGTVSNVKDVFTNTNPGGYGASILFDMATAIAYPSGQQVYPDGVGVVNRGTTVTQVASVGTATAGRRRLVGLALEVHNTTADIYKQGTVTSYVVPQSVTSDSAMGGTLYVNNGTVASFVDGSTVPASDWSGVVSETHYDVLTSPPATTAAALAYEGSRQWNASEGSYSVARFHSQNPLMQNEFGHVAFTIGDIATKATGTQFNNGGTPLPDDSFATKSVGSNLSGGTMYIFRAANEGYLVLPIQMSGAIYTGLSPQTTLTATWKAIWEVSPSVSDQTSAALVYSTHPSPPHDPLALKLYQEIASRMPVAVPVGMNAAGEYWSQVVEAVKSAMSYVAPVLRSIDHPIAQLAGAAFDHVVQRQDNTNFRPQTSNAPYVVSVSKPQRANRTVRPLVASRAAAKPKRKKNKNRK